MVLAARSKDGLGGTRDLVLQECKEAAVRVSCIEADLSGGPALHDAIESFFSKPPEVPDGAHVTLVNNAGSVGPIGPVGEVDADDLRKALEFNVVACHAATKRFLQLYHGRVSRCTVVNVSSLAAVQPINFMGVYCIGKAARDMMHRAFALEFPKVRVLNYAPGPMDTAMYDEILASYPASSRHSALPDKEALVDPNESAARLVGLLERDDFENGSHVDFFDLDHLRGS